MARQYYNNYNKSYKLDPWTTDDIKYFDKIENIFKSYVTVEKFDSKKYALNLVKIPSTGWFDYDGEISTIDKKTFEFWQDFAITVKVIEDHDRHIKEKVYTEEEIKEYREKTKYMFSANNNFEELARYGKTLPEYNRNVYIVCGSDKYGSKTRLSFNRMEDAKAYAKGLEKGRIYRVNSYELYKVSIGLKEFEDIILDEIKIDK